MVAIPPRAPSLPEKEHLVGTPHLYECFKKLELWMQQAAQWMAAVDSKIGTASPFPVTPVVPPTPVAAPTVTSISPSTGDVAGGIPVTITGTDFQFGATATVGGVALTSAMALGPTTITGTIAAHAAGAVDVIVTNPDTQTGTLTSGFTYTAPAGTPYILTETVGTLRNDGTWFVGFLFGTDGNTPTVSHLGRWKVAGNTQTHNIYLYQYVDGLSDTQIGTVSIDLSAEPDGAFAYAALGSPVTLIAATNYYIISQETASGDEWYSDDTTLDSFTPSVGTVAGSCANSTLGVFGDVAGGGGLIAFGPVNFRVI